METKRSILVLHQCLDAEKLWTQGIQPGKLVCSLRPLADRWPGSWDAAVGSGCDEAGGLGTGSFGVRGPGSIRKLENVESETLGSNSDSHMYLIYDIGWPR